MANYGTGDYTNFRNLRVRGNVGDAGNDPGAVRFVATSAFEGTLAMDGTYSDQNYSYTLPAKSGKFGVSGTFLVGLPAISAATGIYTTAVTVAGLRAEDGLVVNASFAVDSTARIFLGAVPSANTVTLSFYNLGVAQNYREYIFGYTAVR